MKTIPLRSPIKELAFFTLTKLRPVARTPAALFKKDPEEVKEQLPKANAYKKPLVEFGALLDTSLL